tara:strand:+ start:858 stop:1067 length:210 start_codon:yes stop_codon:yes gene_type:complete
MKVGDLVTMPNAGGIGDEAGDRAVGIVVRIVSPPLGGRQGSPRARILWSDGGGRLDWEPMAWLEVINES